MSTLVVILAHGKVQQTFDRHLPFWQAHKSDIVAISPRDDPIEYHGPSYVCGNSSHSGESANYRIQMAMDLIRERQKYMHGIIYEYDSFCLDVQSIRWCSGFFGNVQKNNEQRFVSPFYPNPPWIIDVESLSKMKTVGEKYPSIFEDGFHDRYLAALAHIAGVPIFNHVPIGFTQIALDWAGRWGLIQAIGWGGTMIHGIKTEQQLKAVLEVWRNKDVLRKLDAVL